VGWSGTADPAAGAVIGGWLGGVGLRRRLAAMVRMPIRMRTTGQMYWPSRLEKPPSAAMPTKVRMPPGMSGQKRA
jgi:hypothetical protein